MMNVIALSLTRMQYCVNFVAVLSVCVLVHGLVCVIQCPDHCYK